LLANGDPDSAGVIQSAIESFAQELAGVMQKCLKLKAWKDAERLVIGGGFTGHGDEKLNRDDAIDGLTKMLRRLISRAKKEDFRLAPFSASAARAGLTRKAPSKPALRTCPEILKAAASISRQLCTRQSLRSANTRQQY
jgi:hypothetical protein